MVPKICTQLARRLAGEEANSGQWVKTCPPRSDGHPQEKRFVVGPHYPTRNFRRSCVRRRGRMVNKTSASFPSSTIQCGGVRMPAGVQRIRLLPAARSIFRGSLVDRRSAVPSGRARGVPSQHSRPGPTAIFRSKGGERVLHTKRKDRSAPRRAAIHAPGSGGCRHSARATAGPETISIPSERQSDLRRFSDAVDG